MGFRRRLVSGFAAPACGLLAALLLLGWLARYPGFYADKLLLACLAAAFVWALWQRTQRTNRLIARFVASLEHGDLAQAFRTTGRGSGLDELGASFDDALQKLRDQRHASAAENRFASALVDEAPTPLLAVDGAGTVHLANKAARSLFREADGRQIQAFARYGDELAGILATAPAGDRRVCRVRWNGLFQRAIVAVALADRQGEQWRIVSIQIIQGELDAAEMATQVDLVRVLTHEIMNSLTPVTSLAVSAARDLAALDGSDPNALEDARLAVNALSRRAQAITQFVEAYREFSAAPSISAHPFEAAPWQRDLDRTFRAMPEGEGVLFESRLESAGFTIDGDANLLGQVALNLLKNAGQAAKASALPTVVFEIASNEAGRIVLSVSDNGTGVPPALREEIFLPFFTTKKDGTGVGLSFAKQIVLLHGGAIGLAEPVLGGATFQIVL